VGEDARWMQRAIELAWRGWGRVHPNPLVGAVVVRGGVVVGEGWHEHFGEAHAEVNALRAAAEQAHDATLYVTLEPCAHHGKTPPCTDAVLAAGVRRVVIAVGDPNPAAGGGADRLRAAGVDVLVGLEEEAARRQNHAFFHQHTRPGPYVALKLALSLDARIAAAPGERTALTGAAALAEVHRLRAGFDAILIGSSTALVDDPLLTVRGAPVRVPPVRVVLDSGLRLPRSSSLVRSVADAPLLVLSATPDAARRRELERLGVEVEVVPAGPGGLEVAGVLAALSRRRLGALLVEGGGRVAASVLTAGVVRRLHLFYAPRLLGRLAVPAFPLDRPTHPWKLVRLRRFDDDLYLVHDAD
jgi:diaminohydroxyphosphoribosylaminopyrimidine deaminase / 5-amino-6-(5-phosphoribosylamino)uracil reductase